MKFNIKSMAIGVVIGATLVSGVVMATPIGRNLWAEFANIGIWVDGERLIPRDVAGREVEPFVVDGTTFVPIRAISQAFGNDVEWSMSFRGVSTTDQTVVEWEPHRVLITNQVAADNIKAQMAGDWVWPGAVHSSRWRFHADGRWEEESFDGYSRGGRNRVISAGNGIYAIRQTLEQSTRPVEQSLIGHEFEINHIFRASDGRLYRVTGGSDHPEGYQLLLLVRE